VVGVDGTDESLAAITWAASEALLHHTPLDIVAAVPSEATSPAYAGAPAAYFQDCLYRALADIARAVTHAQTAARRAGLVLTTREHTPDGSAGEVLVDASKNARMVVTGIHRTHRTRCSVVGSTSWELAGHAQCPVVVVKSEPASHRGPSPTIVVGVDGSQNAARALDAAFAEAAVRDARLIVAHVQDRHGTDGPPDALCDGASNMVVPDDSGTVSAMVAPRQLAYPELVVEQQMLDNGPAAQLAAAAAGADLLVVGRRGRAAAAPVTLGSTSVRLLASVGYPLMLVD
jgi:nucleotide-binding universal stress UspA family protein